MTVARIRSLTRKPTRLKAIADGLLGEVVVLMDRQLDDALKIMQTEPPPKLDSSYIRTHTYQRSWRRTDVRSTSSGLIGTLNSDAIDPEGKHYSEIVGGDESGEGQLGMHRDTGWPLVAVALREGELGGRSFSSKLRAVIRKAVS